MEDLRREYEWGELSEADVLSDPLEQFRNWFDDALDAEEPLPDAMTLATVDAEGAPNGRIVVLRGVSELGFAFYTSYESAKGRELSACADAALVFHWKTCERQVRLRGKVERLSREAGETYFAGRPRDSQIAATASPQSSIVSDRAELEARFEEIAQRHDDDKPMAAPETWGGYRLKPDTIEFWQGRVGRLHDRLRYVRTDGDNWRLERLAP